MIPFLQNIRMLIAYAELRPLSNPIGTGRYLQTFLTYRIYFNIHQWHVRPPYFKELVGNIRLNTMQAKLAKNLIILGMIYFVEHLMGGKLWKP